MRREGTLEEISDGKLYEAKDMVRANCLDCKGCSDCCKGMGNTIQLDPFDVNRLCKGLECGFDRLTADGFVELSVVDGMVLPSLKMKEETGACAFLNEEGRCSIHGIRPGICRLFPLGRYYEEDRFWYFLQTKECRLEHRAKIKVGKWIDTPELEKYEKFIFCWHRLLVDIDGWLGENGVENISQMATAVLQFFYGNPYGGQGFFEEYASREEKFRRAFGM